MHKPRTLWTPNEMELMLDDEGDPNTVSETNSMPFLYLNCQNRFSHQPFFITKLLPWEHKTSIISSGKHLRKKMTAQMRLAPWLYGTIDWMHPKDPLQLPRRSHQYRHYALFLISQGKSAVKCLKDLYLSCNYSKPKTSYTNGLGMFNSTRNEYSYTICPSQRYIKNPIHVRTIIIIKPVNVNNHKINTSHHRKSPSEAWICLMDTYRP